MTAFRLATFADTADLDVDSEGCIFLKEIAGSSLWNLPAFPAFPPLPHVLPITCFVGDTLHRFEASMGQEVEAGASSNHRERSCLAAILSILGPVVHFLRTLWRLLSLCSSHTNASYSPRRLAVDCEKGPVAVCQTHAALLASLKRREAADAMFETEVMALLAPVKLRLAEIARESVLDDIDAVSGLSPAPQLFYGRERELFALVRMFAQGRQAHAALLGEAGAGKSTLALALLHRPEIISQFGPRRFFVRGALSDVAGVAVRLSSALGLRLSHTPRDPDSPQAFVLAALSSCPFDSLIVLDDLDDAWASPHTRPALGAFLADLAAIPSVSLLLTLRGAQRPLGLVYTQPYPAPLGPLPLSAARTLFRAISGLSAGSVNDADVPCADGAAAWPLLADVGIAALSRGAVRAEPTLGPDDALLDALLHHAECLPQAVVLLAQRAQYEPLPFLLARLEEGDV